VKMAEHVDCRCPLHISDIELYSGNGKWLNGVQTAPEVPLPL
jgi:hypothetical protein